ncbi:MAG: hypothetical protein NW223_24600 [Hyphomicrobiaceae bacterium]|nr:hypothetical protein [Hyphomicrobiaceae bacterium]
MLTLDLPAEPFWLDLPRGVRVEIRPVTTAVMAAAQAAATRRLAAIRIADSDLDPDMSRGLSFAFLGSGFTYVPGCAHLPLFAISDA